MDTTISIWVVIVVMGGHFLGDFVYQTHYMSRMKSRDTGVLMSHVLVYSLIVATAAIAAANIVDPNYTAEPFWRYGGDWALFWAITFAAHAVTDYITSPITSNLWGIARSEDAEDRDQASHNFFVVIGADQWAHYVQLFLTYQWVFGSPN